MPQLSECASVAELKKRCKKVSTREEAKLESTSKGRAEATERRTNESTGDDDNTTLCQPRKQENFILALGQNGNNQIFRRDDSKWEKWKKGKDFGVRFTAVGLKYNLFVIGGLKNQGMQVNIYDLKSGAWVVGPRLNVERCGAAAGFVAFSNHLFVTGGWNHTDDTLRSVETLRLSSDDGQPIGDWQFVAPMKACRWYCAASTVGNKIFVPGGQDEASDIIASVESYDVITSSWTNLASMLEKRWEHSMTSFDGTIYVFGGENGFEKLASCEKYSPEENVWSYIKPLSIPRFDCGVALMNDVIYIVGGNRVDSRKLVEVYDPKKDEWSTGPELIESIGYPVRCASW